MFFNKIYVFYNPSVTLRVPPPNLHSKFLHKGRLWGQIYFHETASLLKRLFFEDGRPQVAPTKDRKQKIPSSLKKTFCMRSYNSKLIIFLFIFSAYFSAVYAPPLLRLMEKITRSDCSIIHRFFNVIAYLGCAPFTISGMTI